MIEYLKFCWRQRNTPWRDMAEEYALLTKMARRCAYDLGHAASAYQPEGWHKMWSEKSDRWLSIFSPDGIKDYRHSLYNDIDKLELRVERLREFCKANGLDPEEVDETMPF